MRILSAVSCTSCWASSVSRVLLGARAHVPHWQRVWKHHGWFLMWDMTWCNNANSSRYSQWDSVCKYFELGQCVACTVQYIDDGAVTEKIVNLSPIIVMACYMVEMTPWCIMGRWTLVRTSELSCHWYPGHHPAPGPAAQKRKRLARAGQSRPCVPINVHSGLWAESDNKM